MKHIERRMGRERNVSVYDKLFQVAIPGRHHDYSLGIGRDDIFRSDRRIFVVAALFIN